MVKGHYLQKLQNMEINSPSLSGRVFASSVTIAMKCGTILCKMNNAVASSMPLKSEYNTLYQFEKGRGG